MKLPRSDEVRVERAMAIDVMKSSGRFGSINSNPPTGCPIYEYRRLSSRQEAHERLRIAVDCANGPGGL